jgi:hypothetical protein
MPNRRTVLNSKLCGCDLLLLAARSALSLLLLFLLRLVSAAHEHSHGTNTMDHIFNILRRLELKE